METDEARYRRVRREIERKRQYLCDWFASLTDSERGDFISDLLDDYCKDCYRVMGPDERRCYCTWDD